MELHAVFLLEIMDTSDLKGRFGLLQVFGFLDMIMLARFSYCSLAYSLFASLTHHIVRLSIIR